MAGGDAQPWSRGTSRRRKTNLVAETIRSSWMPRNLLPSVGCVPCRATGSGSLLEAVQRRGARLPLLAWCTEASQRHI